MCKQLALAALVLVVPACREKPMPTAPMLPPGPPSASSAIERGSYISAVSGCAVCHTPKQDGIPDRARRFAGGSEGRIGDGVWRMPNITLDRDTGIGAWNDAQIINVIRRGVRPDGSRLVPMMPYPSYHRMTDGDVRAVVAFLRAQKPVVNLVERSEGLPMEPVDLPEPVGNIDKVDDIKAHGEYLATLAHCAACHTPMQGSFAGAAFAGGTEFQINGKTVVAPNITSDPTTGIGTWTVEQIAQAVRTMKTPKGHSIEEPMADYAEGWSKLDDYDARALATYIKSVAPVKHPVPEKQPEVTQRR